MATDQSAPNTTENPFASPPLSKDSRRRLIAAFDQLVAIERLGPKTKGSRGTYLHCDACGSIVGGHKLHCPLPPLLDRLVAIIPKFNDREKWIAEGRDDAE